MARDTLQNGKLQTGKENLAGLHTVHDAFSRDANFYKRARFETGKQNFCDPFCRDSHQGWGGLGSFFDLNSVRSTQLNAIVAFVLFDAFVYICHC